MSDNEALITSDESCCLGRYSNHGALATCVISSSGRCCVDEWGETEVFDETSVA